MKICIIVPTDLPVPTVRGGAVETLVEYLILENEIKQKAEIDLYTIEDTKAVQKEREWNLQKTNIIHAPAAPKKVNKIINIVYRLLKQGPKIYIPHSLEYIRMLQELKKHKDEYDYVVYEAGETAQLPRLSKIIPKEKLYVHVHWDGYWNRGDMPRIDDSFGTLVPVSQYIGNNWIKKTGCNPNKVRVLKNCARLELFNKRSSHQEQIEFRKKLGIPTDNKVILFTGRILEIKGVRELIKAFSILEMDKVSLVIVGSSNFGNETSTPYEKEIEDLLAKVRKNKSIVFTGYMHQTELYKCYSIADIAVMPSLFQDPAPLVGIESQASGTPLIATKVGGVPEYVTPDSAILVDADDNLVDNLAKNCKLLLENDQLREKLSLAGVKNAMQYSTSAYYENFLNVLKRGDQEE